MFLVSASKIKGWENRIFVSLPLQSETLHRKKERRGETQQKKGESEIWDEGMDLFFDVRFVVVVIKQKWRMKERVGGKKDSITSQVLSLIRVFWPLNACRSFLCHFLSF